jgi:hypothetical protein
MYTPCEVALSEFTLMDGVRKVYHTLIDPGKYTTKLFLRFCVWLVDLSMQSIYKTSSKVHVSFTFRFNLYTNVLQFNTEIYIKKICIS